MSNSYMDGDVKLFLSIYINVCQNHGSVLIGPEQNYKISEAKLCVELIVAPQPTNLESSCEILLMPFV